MKAILVINMPKNCVECPCEHRQLCLVKCGVVESIDRPSWCPLKPMTTRQETAWARGVATNEAYIEGWNDCLDEITGEKE